MIDRDMDFTFVDKKGIRFWIKQTVHFYHASARVMDRGDRADHSGIGHSKEEAVNACMKEVMEHLWSRCCGG